MKTLMLSIIMVLLLATGANAGKLYQKSWGYPAVNPDAYDVVDFGVWYHGTYPNLTTTLRGTWIGRDPDPRIRFEINRDRSRFGE